MLFTIFHHYFIDADDKPTKRKSNHQWDANEGKYVGESYKKNFFLV